MNESTQEQYNIRQLSQEFHTPSQTLRRFCSRGLVPGVRRTRTGRLTFMPEQATWLRTLVFLQSCGFSSSELKRYATLCRQGNDTIPKRKAMLETKKRQIWQTIEDAQANIDFIERKTDIFDQALAGNGELPSQWF